MAAVRATGVRPYRCGTISAWCCTSKPSNKGPPVGSGMYCPVPGSAYSLPASQRSRPRLTVETTRPLIRIPSYTLLSIRLWWVDALSTCSSLGSKTMTSASLPTAMWPLRGYMLKVWAAAVLVTRT
eukprot:361754-Chlamydomonas_euryale.AAC.5